MSTPNFEFGDALYTNSQDMHSAIAEAYLTADGANGREDVHSILSENTDEELAEEVQAQWFSEEDDAARGFDLEDMVRAFAAVRQEFDGGAST